MSTPKLIHSRQLYKALLAIGVFREEDNVRRFVIDADVDSAVILYVERYGDERMLDVVPTIAQGVEIRGVPTP